MRKPNRKQRELIEQYEKGLILHVDDGVDNRQHLQTLKTKEVENETSD